MNSKQPLAWYFMAPILLVLSLPNIVFGHTGVGNSSGFWNGVVHPITGLDHICAMVGVGLWAAQRGGRSLWLVPLAFIVVMAVGGLLGMLAISVPLVERGTIASVLIIGVLIAAAVRLPLLLSVLIVGLFALFHGHAHGAEMPQTASGVLYGIGFLVTTAFLHMSGIAVGLLARQSASTWLLRYAGAAIVLCGLYLALPI